MVRGIKRWQASYYIVILPITAFLMLFNVNFVWAGPCVEAGGTDCYVTCPSGGGWVELGLMGCGSDYGTTGTKCCGEPQGPPAPVETSGIVPDGGKMETGDYELNDFLKITINVSRWILGITGSLALLMFIYGGVMFLISSGSSEKVTQAKGIIVGAVVGLVIVFAAYTIISFTFKAMGLKWKGTTEQPKIEEAANKPITPPPNNQ